MTPAEALKYQQGRKFAGTLGCTEHEIVAEHILNDLAHHGTWVAYLKQADYLGSERDKRFWNHAHTSSEPMPPCTFDRYVEHRHGDLFVINELFYEKVTGKKMPGHIQMSLAWGSTDHFPQHIVNASGQNISGLQAYLIRTSAMSYVFVDVAGKQTEASSWTDDENRMLENGAWRVVSQAHAEKIRVQNLKQNLRQKFPQYIVRRDNKKFARGILFLDRIDPVNYFERGCGFVNKQSWTACCEEHLDSGEWVIISHAEAMALKDSAVVASLNCSGNDSISEQHNTNCAPELSDHIDTHSSLAHAVSIRDGIVALNATVKESLNQLTSSKPMTPERFLRCQVRHERIKSLQSSLKRIQTYDFAEFDLSNVPGEIIERFRAEAVANVEAQLATATKEFEEC